MYIAAHIENTQKMCLSPDIWLVFYVFATHITIRANHRDKFPFSVFINPPKKKKKCREAYA